jgi:hypothetical protein
MPPTDDLIPLTPAEPERADRLGVAEAGLEVVGGGIEAAVEVATVGAEVAVTVAEAGVEIAGGLAEAVVGGLGEAASGCSFVVVLFLLVGLSAGMAAAGCFT